MRDRAWRRYKEDLKVIKRLLKHNTSHHYYRFKDSNNVSFQHTSISNYIGSDTHYMYKTHTTKIHDSRYKTKYSPNSKSSYYRDTHKKGKRETNKILFITILKEYGII